MNKNILKSLFIFLLIIWCLYDIYGTLQVKNNYELIIGFMVLTLVPAIILFPLSFSLKANSFGSQRILAIVGISVGIITFLVNILVFIWNSVR